MRIFLLIPLLSAVTAFAANESQIKFSFKNAEITDVIEAYSKATGQKFIIDANVRGRVSILNQDKISLDEAFAQMSSALAINGMGLSKQGEVYSVMQARAIQRNQIGVGTELPPMRPEQMFTWIVNLKYTSADRINRELRILTSKDGELVPYTGTNQIIISDWLSNLYRVQKILAALDVPGSDGGPQKESPKIKGRLIPPPANPANPPPAPPPPHKEG